MTPEEKKRFNDVKAIRDKEWNEVQEVAKAHKGKRVKITKVDHPHSGRTGVFKGIDKTLSGAAILVRLDGKMAFFGECYVFSVLDLKFIDDE